MEDSQTHRVLLIDDDLSRRIALSRRFRDAGFDVRLADDGPAALELTRGLRPDVVLCDRWMAGIDGVEFCRTVKSDPDLRATYVFVVVDGDGREDIVDALDSGADDILLRSVDLDVLLAKIRAGMRAREIQRCLSRTQHGSMPDEIAATIGQKINNPLSGVLGHLELVHMYLDRGEVRQVRHHLDEASRNAHRIGEVSYRLLATAGPKATRTIGYPLALDLDGRLIDPSAEASSSSSASDN